MKKRLSFVFLIATFHFLFACASVGHKNCLCEAGSLIISPLAKLLLSPLYYPLTRGHVVSAALVVPLLAANSLLWGFMAERLVWGRKKVARRVNTR